MTSPTEKKKYVSANFFMLVPYSKFQDPIFNLSWLYAKRNGQTDTPKPICPLNFFEVGVGIHKKTGIKL